MIRNLLIFLSSSLLASPSAAQEDNPDKGKLMLMLCWVAQSPDEFPSWSPMLTPDSVMVVLQTGIEPIEQSIAPTSDTFDASWFVEGNRNYEEWMAGPVPVEIHVYRHGIAGSKKSLDAVISLMSDPADKVIEGRGDRTEGSIGVSGNNRVSTLEANWDRPSRMYWSDNEIGPGLVGNDAFNCKRPWAVDPQELPS